MKRRRWNRQTKRSERYLADLKDEVTNSGGKARPPQPYKVSRVRPKNRKPRHPGYTIIPNHRLWIFDK